MPVGSLRLAFDALIIFFMVSYWLYIPLHLTFQISLNDVFFKGFSEIQLFFYIMEIFIYINTGYYDKG